MARVFLSYSRQDRAIAESLASALEKAGHILWWDRNLEGGSRFASEIEAELERAEAVVVLWSPHSLKSAWVQDEAAEGRDSGRLVPVALGDIKPPLGFRQFHTIALPARGIVSAQSATAIDAAIAKIAGQGALAAKAESSAGARRWPRRRLGMVALAGALVLALGSLWTWRDAEGESARLALGQFAALSPQVPSSAAAALREELLAAIGTDGRIEVGEAKGDAYVAGGSIRASSDRLRFTLHLARADQSRQIWATSFEQPLAEADVAPRRVAAAASTLLRCGLSGRSDPGGAIGDEALALYLNYCAEYWAETAGRTMSATRGLDFARRLVEIEPGFSRGWSARGRMASWAVRGASPAEADRLRMEAAEAARKALALDPRNSQGHEVLAALEPRNSLARERHHQRSVSVRPGDCGCEHVGYGGFLAGVGRLSEAIVQFRRARDIVPLSVSVNASLAESLHAAGRSDEAARLAAPILEIWPGARQMHEMLVRTAFWSGDKAAARRSLADPRSHFTAAERAAFGAALDAGSGGAPTRDAAVRRLTALASDPSSRSSLLVTALGALGAHREAMQLAGEMFGAAGSPDQFVLFEPALEQTRRTAEFWALAGRLGLVRYWRESRIRPEFCRTKDAPAQCRALG